MEMFVKVETVGLVIRRLEQHLNLKEVSLPHLRFMEAMNDAT